MSAFTIVSLFADASNQTCPLSHQVFARHPWWDNQRGWSRCSSFIARLCDLLLHRLLFSSAYMMEEG